MLRFSIRQLWHCLLPDQWFKFGSRKVGFNIRLSKQVHISMIYQLLWRSSDSSLRFGHPRLLISSASLLPSLMIRGHASFPEHIRLGLLPAGFVRLDGVPYNNNNNARGVCRSLVEGTLSGDAGAGILSVVCLIPRPPYVILPNLGSVKSDNDISYRCACLVS